MIIALTGEKGSGKTTIAEYLETKYNFTHCAIAQPLKQIASIFGFTDKELNGSQIDKTTINPRLGICAREFLQKFGTEICRETLPNVMPDLDLGNSGIIWIKLLQEKLDELTEKKENVVVSDVRFFDEIDAIKNYENAFTIKIRRYEKIGRFDVFSSHESENLSNHIKTDFEIYNDSTYEKLFEKVDDIIDKINDRQITKSTSFICDLMNEELADMADAGYLSKSLSLSNSWNKKNIKPLCENESENFIDYETTDDEFGDK